MIDQKGNAAASAAIFLPALVGMALMIFSAGSDVVRHSRILEAVRTTVNKQLSLSDRRKRVDFVQHAGVTYFDAVDCQSLLTELKKELAGESELDEGVLLRVSFIEVSINQSSGSVISDSGYALTEICEVGQGPRNLGALSTAIQNYISSFRGDALAIPLSYVDFSIRSFKNNKFMPSSTLISLEVVAPRTGVFGFGVGEVIYVNEIAFPKRYNI